MTDSNTVALTVDTIERHGAHTFVLARDAHDLWRGYYLKPGEPEPMPGEAIQVSATRLRGEAVEHRDALQASAPDGMRLVSRSADEFRQNLRSGGSILHQVYGLAPEAVRAIVAEHGPRSVALHLWVARSESAADGSVYLHAPAT